MIEYADEAIDFVGERIGFRPYPAHGVAIFHDEEIVGGLVYWRFQYEYGQLCDVELSMALDRPQSMTRRVLDMMTRYPFAGLGSERLTARIAVTNQRSARLARRIGMVEEGLIRRGRFVDHRLFGMLKGEWHERST